MGCLKKLFIRIILIILVVAFFYFGGGRILGDLIKRYQNPPREVVIKSAQVFGNFEEVESDYQIGRTLKLPNYSKMTVLHKPSSQKIRFIKMPIEKGIKDGDFTQNIADEKLQEFIKNNNIQAISNGNVKVNNIGELKYKGKNINYADFTITIEKNFLKQDFNGFIGYHNITEDDKKDNQVVIVSLRGKDKFSEKIVRDLLQTIDLN